MQKLFKIGDIVSLINDNVKGKVISVNGNEISIEDSDGFERVYQANELIIYDSKLADDRSLSIKDFNTKKTKKIAVSNPDIVDLHNTNSYLAKDRILKNQLKIFKRYLNQAIGRKELQIVFIHGKGEGILRTAIEKILKKNAIKYSDASYQKFGQGAIEVYLSGVNKIVR